MKGWKTIAFNVLAAILPILEGFDITTLFSNPKVAIGNAILRAFTSTPIFKKE